MSVSHKKAKRVAREWTKTFPPETAHARMGEAYLDLRRGVDLMCAALDAYGLDKFERICGCDECIRGEAIADFRKALKK